QVLPCSRHAWNYRLHGEPALGADLARYAGHLRGESVELIDHRVDGVLQRENFALHIDGNLAREISLRHGGCHLPDLADLACQVRRHEAPAVSEVLPGAGYAGHRRLAAELAVRADLTRHAGHFGGETVKLIDHRVDGFLQLQELSFHIDRDLARKIA